MVNIPEVFRKSDTIFHYCKLSTALEDILYNKKLRLSPRYKSLDPVENLPPSLFCAGGVFRGGEESEEIRTKHASDIEKLHTIRSEQYKIHKQLCFCMNHKPNSAHESEEWPLEYYGFLKPRMWDQYANGYKGVCLAYSLEKLVHENGDLKHGNIRYLPYSKFDPLYGRIDLNDLHTIGFKEYEAQYRDKLSESILLKHKDYEGENEYRLYKLSKKKYIEISIGDSLRGIIVSQNFTKEFSLNALKEYADEFKVELLLIQWSDANISIQTKEEDDKFYKGLEDDLRELET
jgi:hypothetical protein